MIKLDGQPYNPGTPFTRSGTQYPGNWYQCATPTERLDMGFQELPDPIPFDQRFWFDRNSKGKLLPRPPEEVKNWIIAEARAIAAQIIAQKYDWRAMRAYMNGQPCPPEVVSGAAAVRARSNEIEAAATAAASLKKAADAVQALEAIDRSFTKVNS